ncbi:hypothetical protein [Nocardiopsis sp. FIRDI 009]|uniref:hypothetical protein n=1 Tax=Nocardiopsis sp. FIRDI 009 TaxID=714197 RepID=UPI0018E53ABE|nr:hypothetical protein [Nocardiopsis sp. FIRDI 009]
MRDVPLREALDGARAEPERHDGHGETSAALEFGPAPPTDPKFGLPPGSWFGRYGQA